MAVPAASTFSPIGPENVFIPGYDGDARARLLIEYVLNPKKFMFNQYVTITPVSLPVGFYKKILASDYIRVQQADGKDSRWVDGTPSGAYTNREQGPRETNIQYELLRVKRERNVGWLTQSNSPYDVLKETQNMLTSISMTYRAQNIITAITTAGNYDSTHVSTATSISGGFWSAGTINSPYIKEGLDNIRDTILKDSIGMVKVNDLRLVVSPTLASAMSRSQEIHAYLAQQSNSLPVLEGKNPDAEANWSLPKYYNGFEIVVEPAVIITSAPTANATTATDGTATYILDPNKAFVAARPGSLVSESGGINFSTCHVLELKNHAFKVYMEDMGERDQFTYIRVEDYFQPIIAAPETGYLVTNCTS